MVLVIKSGGVAGFKLWQAAFAELAPDWKVYGWHEEDIDLASVQYALVWEPDAGRLAQFPNLRMILSVAAGVDHILADPLLPAHLPIVRMITTETAERMADFVTMSALAVIRDLPALIHAQKNKNWNMLQGRVSSQIRVGIMGLGELGAFTAKRLTANGFQVSGWSRSLKTIDGVTCYAGPGDFDAFLGQTDILVNLLPNTTETRNVINADLMAKLPRGASIINTGRSSHIDHAALIAALDSDHLHSAVLDVFDVEPLPVDDPLWTHPKIIVTPHIASTVTQATRARQAFKTIQAHDSGLPFAHLFDRERGY